MLYSGSSISSTYVMHIYTYMHIYTCMCIYIYIYTYTYIQVPMTVFAVLSGAANDNY